MAYFIENDDGTVTMHASPNVKIYMKLEDPKETYDLFEKCIDENTLLEPLKNEDEVSFKKVI